MADPEDRERHSRRRKRTYYEKASKPYDRNDLKGAFSTKILPKRNSPYKREKINKTKTELEIE